jgi:NAD(P)-dependent dehydrogenase (short-subunit alcohol dehydrogenase family)
MSWLCRAALPRMKGGSTIINTASVQSYDPSAHLLAYAPTKAAIVSFTKALAPMAMKNGVRVNAVAPGPVWTPSTFSATQPNRGSGMRVVPYDTPGGQRTGVRLRSAKIGMCFR